METGQSYSLLESWKQVKVTAFGIMETGQSYSLFEIMETGQSYSLLES